MVIKKRCKSTKFYSMYDSALVLLIMFEFFLANADSNSESKGTHYEAKEHTVHTFTLRQCQVFLNVVNLNCTVK